MATTAVIMLIGVWLLLSPVAEALPPLYWPLLTLAGYVVLTQLLKAWLLRRGRVD
jgi:hypothetical protein